jgi:hypothetical protein
MILGVKPIRTAFNSPWQNEIAERFVGSYRRDLSSPLNHNIDSNQPFGIAVGLYRSELSKLDVDGIFLRDNPILEPELPAPSGNLAEFTRTKSSDVRQ